jgi:hypothetical protein
MAKVTMLLSLFCFLFTFNSIAQETHFGVKAGLNYSSVVGDLTEGLKFRFSGHGGVYVESEVSDKFALQIALLYSSQGFQFSSDLQSIQTGGNTFDQSDIRTNVQLNYLTVPVLGKFALSDRVAVEFGPQFGFLLNQVSKIKNLDQRDDTIPENRTSISGEFQLDYGVVAGLDFEIMDSISLEPRFYIGLRNRLNGLGGNIQNYNAAIQVSVNYAIN